MTIGDLAVFVLGGRAFGGRVVVSDIVCLNVKGLWGDFSQNGPKLDSRFLSFLFCFLDIN